MLSQDADLFNSVQPGDWSDNTTWSTTGSDLDGIPDSDDDVVISHNIDLNSASQFGSLLIDPSGVLAMNSNQINMYGNFHNDGQISGSGTLLASSNAEISGTGVWSSSIYWVASGNIIFITSLEIGSNLSLVGGGDVIIDSGFTITTSSIVRSFSSASILINLGTINISNSSFLITNNPASSIFYSNSGDVVYSTSGDFPVPRDGGYKNVTISALGNASCNGDFSITENFTNSGVFNSTITGNVITFNGASTQTISGSGLSNLKNLVLDNSSGLAISSGTLNIEEVFSLTNGNATNSSATVLLQSNSDNTAGQIFLSSNSYFGNITVERFIPTSSQGYRMFGSPVQLTTLANWQDDGIIFSGFTGAEFTSAQSGGYTNSYAYNESQASDANKEDGWVASDNISNSTVPSSGTWIYTDASTYKLSVTGELYLGDQSISVQKGGVTDQRGWNLITNPYACNLDWDLFYADNSSIVDNAFWVYDADAGNNVFYSGAGGGTLSNVLAHSQGVWVHKNSTGTGNITFKQSHLTTTATEYVKSTNGINTPLQIKISGDINGFHDYSFIKAVSSATANFDQGLDVIKSFSPMPNYAPNVYVISADSINLGASLINSNQSVDIALGVNVGAFAYGNYTLDFSNLEQFMIGSCITLEDLENGTIIDLRTDSTYTFPLIASSINPRFIIHISVDYDINVTNSSCFNNTSALISLTGNGINGSYFNLLHNGILIDSIVASLDSVSFNNLNAGVYSIQTNHVGSCTMSNQDVIVIEPQEVVANFQLNFDTLYLDQIAEIETNNNSTGSSSYLWEFGDGTSSTDESPSHIYNSQGLFQIILYADNENTGNCTDVTSKNVIVMPSNSLSVDQDNSTIDFNLYVANDMILVDFSDYNSGFKCMVTDLNGKILWSKDFQSNIFSEFRINANNFSSGIYFFVLNLNSGEHLTHKFYID